MNIGYLGLGSILLAIFLIMGALEFNLYRCIIVFAVIIGFIKGIEDCRNVDNKRNTRS